MEKDQPKITCHIYYEYTWLQTECIIYQNIIYLMAHFTNLSDLISQGSWWVSAFRCFDSPTYWFFTSQQQPPRTTAILIAVRPIVFFLPLIFVDSTCTTRWFPSRCSFMDPLHSKTKSIKTIWLRMLLEFSN